MRLVSIDSVKPNTVLGKNVYGDGGVMLLRRGTQLKTEYLKRMADMGYYGTFINDAVSDDVYVADVIDDNNRLEAVDAIRNFNEIIAKRPNQMLVQSGKIGKIVNNIVDEILSLHDSVLNLRDLKTLNDYLYQHSVNVAVIAVYLGKLMGLNADKLRELGTAGIFHDIGMASVDRAILMSPGKLNAAQTEEVRKHTTIGFEILKMQLRLSTAAYVAVLQHHERYDQTGYPSKRGGEDISIMARILAVADNYDALTSVRSYRRQFLPSDAYEYITGNSGSHFDPAIVQIFAKSIAPFPAGSTVKLSDGRTALVLENNPNFILRPIIRIVDESKDSFEMIDLAHGTDNLQLTIVDMI